ncbi:hypothetical protein PG996_000986 [Apiospora saccharicola]|uniref:Uncharacterized protein n=1 Tax=Apiospora saccharicola TaxID=335842 RepID=A0ABR1WIA8_9PEZI
MHPALVTALFGLPLIAAQATTATTTPQPDPPAPGRPFLAQLWNNTADCVSDAPYRLIYSSLSCLNYPSPGTGSATVKVGVRGADTLSAWTGPDCTGERIIFDPTHDVCQSLAGRAVQSWNHYLISVDGK